MKSNELLFVVLPLTLFLAGIIFHEIRTGLITDKAVFPAALYFLTASCVVGPKPWWHYVLGMVGVICIFVLLAMAAKNFFGTDMIGGGAIKLLGVTGAALGLYMAVEAGAAFIASICIGLLIARAAFGSDHVPSSPFVFLSVCLIYMKNYGMQFFMPH